MVTENDKLSTALLALPGCGIFLLTFAFIFSPSLVNALKEYGREHPLQKYAISTRPGWEQNAFYMDEIRQLKKILKTDDINCVIAMNINITYNNIKLKTRLVGTNYNYYRFQNLVLEKGAFFSSSAEMGKERVAVLDKELAFKLFKSSDVLGMILDINGTQFRITALFSRQKSIIANRNESIPECIYIPLPLFPGIDSGKLIPYIQIGAENKNRQLILQGEIENALKVIRKDPADYNIADYNEAGILLAQRYRLMLFLSALFIIIGLCVQFKKVVADGIKAFRQSLKTAYLPELVRRCYPQLIRKALLLCLICLAAWGIFLWVRFDLYFPGDSFQIAPLLFGNSGSAFSPGGYSRAAGDYITDGLILLHDVMLILLFPAGSLFVLTGFYRLKVLTGHKMSLALFYCIAFLASTGSTAGLLWIAGIQPVLNLKGLLILWIFIYSPVPAGEVNYA